MIISVLCLFLTVPWIDLDILVIIVYLLEMFKQFLTNDGMTNRPAAGELNI